MVSAIFLILLFYFFAILQVSFFVHFAILGAILNPVFILFMLVVFFLPKKIDYRIFMYAIIAGLLLDAFSYTYFGISVILLFIVGYLFKKMQITLKETGDGYSPAQFFTLFLLWFAVYEIMQILYYKLFDPLHVSMLFGVSFFACIAYNAVVALVGFYIFKKIKSLNANVQS